METYCGDFTLETLLWRLYHGDFTMETLSWRLTLETLAQRFYHGDFTAETFQQTQVYCRNFNMETLL